MKSPKAEVTGVNYSPAKGGVISETSTRKKRPGQGGGSDFDHATEKAVHPTLKHAQDHMASTMGKFFAAKDAAPKQESE